MSAFGWLVTTLVLSCVAGYVFYKYRLRVGTERSLPQSRQQTHSWFFLPSFLIVDSHCLVLQRYMDSEIMAQQYMPLDSQHSENQR